MTDPENTNSPETQISALTAGLGGFAMRIGDILSQDPIERGVHRTEFLAQPVKDSFGEFRKKYTYVAGCRLNGSELVQGIPEDENLGEVVIVSEDTDGTKKHSSIGRTPDQWLPAKGGTPLEDAGEPGEFLLSQQVVKGTRTEVKFRYLDKEDIDGVAVRNGAEQVALGTNPNRGRQLQISGKVTKVVSFLK